MFDIENFPTDETAKELIATVSPIYDEAYVGKWIFQILGLALGASANTIKDLDREAFPETAVNTLDFWEDMYGIATDKEKDIEERRRNIIVKRNFRNVMNPARMAAMISELTGRGVYIRENTDVYEYEVCIEPGESSIDLKAVRTLIDRVRQAKTVRIVPENATRLCALSTIEITDNIVMMCEEEE